MRDRSKFEVGGEGYQADDPAVKRAQAATTVQLTKLAGIVGRPEAERVKEDIIARSRDVETRLMLARQIVGEALTRKKAAAYRTQLATDGFKRLTVHVAAEDAEKLRRLIIAEASKAGIRVKARSPDSPGGRAA